MVDKFELSFLFRENLLSTSRLCLYPSLQLFTHVQSDEI